MRGEEHVLMGLGVRPTAIRQLVLREIVRYGHAFTLADMEHRLPTMDRSSLFRTLTLFVEHRLLHEMDNGSGSKLYCLCDCEHDHDHTPHMHFICTRCGEAFCLKDISLDTLPKPEGYEVTEVSVVMRGVCPKCKS